MRRILIVGDVASCHATRLARRAFIVRPGVPVPAAEKATPIPAFTEKHVLYNIDMFTNI